MRQHCRLLFRTLSLGLSSSEAGTCNCRRCYTQTRFEMLTKMWNPALGSGQNSFHPFRLGIVLIIHSREQRYAIAPFQPRFALRNDCLDGDAWLPNAHLRNGISTNGSSD